MIPAPVTVQFQEHPAGLAKQVYNSALGSGIRKPVVGHNSHTTARFGIGARDQDRGGL
jgi:hypothetical protein